MNKCKNRGITLIALIITIIIMLILVSISIQAVVNGGLFQKAGEAVKDYKSKQTEEEKLGSGALVIDGIEYSSMESYVSLMGQPKLELSYEIVPNTNVENEAIICLNIAGITPPMEISYEEYARMMLEGKTQEEKEQIFVDGDVYYYPDAYEGKENITLAYVLSTWEHDTIEEFLNGGEYENLDVALIELEYVYPEGYDFVNSRTIPQSTIKLPNGINYNTNNNVIAYKVQTTGTYTFEVENLGRKKTITVEATDLNPTTAYSLNEGILYENATNTPVDYEEAYFYKGYELIDVTSIIAEGQINVKGLGTFIATEQENTIIVKKDDKKYAGNLNLAVGTFTLKDGDTGETLGTFNFIEGSTWGEFIGDGISIDSFEFSFFGRKCCCQW